MGRALRWIFCLGCVAIAGVSIAQALSASLANSSPALALSTALYAGKADENLAEGLFRAGELGKARLLSSEAIKTDPLSGKNLALIARSQTDPQKKTQILNAASRVSSRGTVLQGTLLQYYAGKEDIEQMIAALDRILMVNPELAKSVMPIFAQSLSRDGAVAALVPMLRRQPSWKNAFLSSTLDRPELLNPYLNLRRELGSGGSIDKALDIRLIAALLAEDRFADAHEVYRLVSNDTPTRNSSDSTNSLDWNDAIPPFDWQYSDSSDENARVTRDGQSLEINIRAGHGGQIAKRLLILNSDISQITIEHSFAKRARAGEGLRAVLKCNPNGAVLIDELLVSSPAKLRTKSNPNCELYELSFVGRSFSGSRDLMGTILRVAVFLKKGWPEENPSIEIP